MLTCVFVYEHALVLEWESQWADESGRLSHEAGGYSYMDALIINNLQRKRSASAK